MRKRPLLAAPLRLRTLALEREVGDAEEEKETRGRLGDGCARPVRVGGRIHELDEVNRLFLVSTRRPPLCECAERNGIEALSEAQDVFAGMQDDSREGSHGDVLGEPFEMLEIAGRSRPFRFLTHLLDTLRFLLTSLTPLKSLTSPQRTRSRGVRELARAYGVASPPTLRTLRVLRRIS